MQRRNGSQPLIVQNRLIFTNRYRLQQSASLAPHTLHTSHPSVGPTPSFGCSVWQGRVTSAWWEWLLEALSGALQEALWKGSAAEERSF